MRSFADEILFTPLNPRASSSLTERMLVTGTMARIATIASAFNQNR
jgi:hypothetical protein